MQIIFKDDYENPRILWETWYSRCLDTLSAVDAALVKFTTRWNLSLVRFECFRRSNSWLSQSDVEAMVAAIFSKLNKLRRLQIRMPLVRKWVSGVSVHRTEAVLTVMRVRSER